MAQVRGWVAPVLFVVLLVAFAAGIWGVYRAAYPGQGLHRVNGVFERRFTDLMVSVRHEGIPGLMDPMSSMVFMAESKALIDRAKLMPGDRVRLTVRTTGDRLLLVDIQKIQ
jgi:Cu/Ag efflux protein CusF